MEHHEVWEQRVDPATSPNYAPPLNHVDIVPPRFVQNEGSGAVDFPITDSNGVVHQPDYIQIVMMYDPFVIAIVKSSGSCRVCTMQAWSKSGFKSAWSQLTS